MGTIKLAINRVAPSLNVWQTMHWAKREKLKKTWALEFRYLFGPKKPMLQRCKIKYTRFSTGTLDEADNLPGSFKCVGDALVLAGVIKDDSPAVIVSFEAKQVRVKTRKEQRTEITIEEK